MKKKMTHNSVILIQVIFFFSFSYLLFFMYDIWKLGDSMLGYLVYFASFPLIRLIYIPLTTLFVLHNKISHLLTLSFFSNILMSLSIIFIFPHIDNVIIISILYAIFTVTFTTGFTTGFNFVVSTYIKENRMEKYFYTVGFYQNILDTILPIALGLIIIYIAKDMAYVLLIIISIATIIYLNTYEKVDTGKQAIPFKELFAKSGSSSIPKHVTMLHLIFIVAYSGFIQVFEIYGTSYLYTISQDDLQLGIFKVSGVIAVGVLLAIKTRLKYREQFWVLLASAVTVIILPVGFFGGDSVVGLITIVALLLMYVFYSSFTGISFRLFSAESAQNRIVALFQREMLRAVGKGIMGVALLFISAEGIFSQGFYIITGLVLVLLVITLILYVVIEKYIQLRTA